MQKAGAEMASQLSDTSVEPQLPDSGLLDYLPAPGLLPCWLGTPHCQSTVRSLLHPLSVC